MAVDENTKYQQFVGAGAYGLLQDAQDNGVDVSVVNIMTMDFYDGTTDALSDALSAAQAAAGQLASLYGISSSAAYGRMGLTPIAGRNDDGSDFSTSDAQTLESFAASNGVQELSFWEVDGYGKPLGYQYLSIFNQIGSSSTSGGGSTGAQRWQQASNGSLLNPASGNLDDTGPSTTPGTQVQL